MKIGKTASGIFYARYLGFIALGKTSKEAFNNLVDMTHGRI